jgi:HD-like signal output (HDOD) protein
MAKLALSVEVARMLSESDGIPGLHPTQLMRYSKSTSALAARLVEPEDAVDASLVALLSPVGLLLESAALPARLRECYRLADESDRSLVEAERERYGHGHPELAVHLLSIWGLPVDLVDLVGQAFDRPRFDGPHPDRSGPLPVLDAVRVARLLTLHRMADPSIGRPHLDHLSEEELDLLTRWERSLAPVPTNEEDGVVS